MCFLRAKNSVTFVTRVALGLDAKLHEAGPVLEEYIQEGTVQDAAAEGAPPADGLVLTPQEYTAAVRMYAVEASPSHALRGNGQGMLSCSESMVRLLLRMQLHKARCWPSCSSPCWCSTLYFLSCHAAGCWQAGARAGVGAGLRAAPTHG